MSKFKIASWLFYLVSLGTIGFGVLYIYKGMSEEIMSYHYAFLQSDHESVKALLDGKVLKLFNALMMVAGSASLCLGLTGFYITMNPFQKQEKWAWWSLMFLFIISLAGTFYVTSTVASQVPAGGDKPPHILNLVMLILVGIALFLSAKKESK